MTPERTARLLRLARLRGDRLAIATLSPCRPASPIFPDYVMRVARLTESERRLMDGNR